MLGPARMVGNRFKPTKMPGWSVKKSKGLRQTVWKISGPALEKACAVTPKVLFLARCTPSVLPRDEVAEERSG